MTYIVSVDEVCAALEDVLTDHLAATATDLGLDLPAVHTWQQVPTIQAITATVERERPAGAIISPGLVEPPSFRGSRRGYDATWRCVVGIYVRGTDHATTQALVRDYAAAIRTTVLRHKSLGGVATGLLWRGEEHDALPSRETARTIAGAAVAFDVTTEMASIHESRATTLPVVETHFPALDVNP